MNLSKAYRYQLPDLQISLLLSLFYWEASPHMTIFLKLNPTHPMHLKSCIKIKINIFFLFSQLFVVLQMVL